VKKLLLPTFVITVGLLVGALAQNITKSIQLAQAPGVIGIDTSNNVYFPAHILNNGKSPSTSNGSVVGTDFSGTITESTNSIGGVLTFNKAFLTAPNCVVTGQTGTGTSVISYTTTTTNLTWSHLSQVSKLINYFCSSQS